MALFGDKAALALRGCAHFLQGFHFHLGLVPAVVHFTTDAVIGLIEKAHMGVRDQIVLRAAAGVGVPPSAIDTFRRRHTQFFGRVYRGLHTIHWYV